MTEESLSPAARLLRRIKGIGSDARKRMHKAREAGALSRLARRGYPFSAGQLSCGHGAPTNLLFLCEEFFHDDLRGFGGFGKTVQRVAGYLNAHTESPLRAKLYLPQGTPLVTHPEVRRYHETEVILRPATHRTNRSAFESYSRLTNFPGSKFFLSIDWYPSYLYPLYAASAVPLIVWIRDPRDRAEWLKIGGVAEELTFRGIRTAEELAELADEKRESIHRLLALQRSCPRKIVFATKARSLVPLARRAYGMPGLDPHWLPTPIEIPEIDPAEGSTRPSLLYLGRLDPVKRPWIAFELARRRPEIDVVIAGGASVPGAFDHWRRKYADVPNLKFLGHIDGSDKDHQLRKCWGLLNTSIHEAEPVSFLEAFAYGKCVLSCQDTDRKVADYGYYAGEVLGDGSDEKNLDQFDSQIERLLSHPVERREKGSLGREYVKVHHTFANFRELLSRVLNVEGIV